MNLKLFDPSLEGNLFSSTTNPLLNMTLLYEFLYLLTQKFFSLGFFCRQLMEHIRIMVIEYVESIDDEHYLTTIILEKDFSGRDSLEIAVELEILDLIQAPKVEAVIKRIYNSDYDTSGSFFEMSTPYQILCSESTSEVDIEAANRFYAKRDIEGWPQYDSNFNIFKHSIYSRLKGMMIIAFIYFMFTCIYCEAVIKDAVVLRETSKKTISFTLILMTSDEHLEIQ